MHDRVSVTTFTLFISIPPSFCTSSPLLAMLFQHIFHYWELYKQFEYRIAMSLALKSHGRAVKRGESESNISYRVIARDQVISLYQRRWPWLVGCTLYVTPDHLHRYRKPTARNIASRDLHAYRQTRLFALSGLFARGIDHACGSGREIDAPGAFRKQRQCLAIAFFNGKITADYSRLLCKIFTRNGGYLFFNLDPASPIRKRKSKEKSNVGESDRSIRGTLLRGVLRNKCFYSAISILLLSLFCLFSLFRSFSTYIRLMLQFLFLPGYTEKKKCKLLFDPSIIL